MYCRRKEYQSIHPWLVFHREDRGHQAAETGPHKPDIGMAGKVLLQFFHPFRKFANKMGYYHVGIMFPEKDRFCPLVVAFQAMDEDSHNASISSVSFISFISFGSLGTCFSLNSSS